MIYVLDVSVVVKWFIPEAGSAAAMRLLDEQHQLLAPDVLWIELASVLRRLVQSKALVDFEAHGILTQVMHMPLHVVPASPLIGPALSLALQHKLSMYDAIYLSLAIQQSATLVTADARLVAPLPSTLRKHARLL